MSLAAFIVRGKNLLSVAGIAIAGGVLAYFAIGQGQESIYLENGLMENSQIGLLFLAFFGFFYAIFRLAGRHRILVMFLALLCFLFAAREFQENFNVPKIILYLVSREGRTVPLIVLLVLFGRIIKDSKHYLQHFSRYLQSYAGLYIFVSALLLLVFAQSFDRKWIVLPYLSFWEEYAELAAYYYLMLASFVAAPSFAAIDAELAAAANG